MAFAFHEAPRSLCAFIPLSVSGVRPFRYLFGSVNVSKVGREFGSPCATVGRETLLAPGFARGLIIVDAVRAIERRTLEIEHVPRRSRRLNTQNR